MARSPFRGKTIYPVYQGQDGERMDFYFSKAHRCWKLRYQKPGQLMVVKLFDQGRSREADFLAADRRTAQEARKRGMVFHHGELRT